jgi:CheY-like chemotaxis protein
MDWELERCRKAGMNEMLTKPVQAAALDQVLLRYAAAAEARQPRVITKS